MNRHLLRAIVGVVLLTTTAPVVAAPSSAPVSVRDGLPNDARAKFDEASRLYRETRYAEARDLFQAVYATSGEPRVLYNVAVCDKALGRYARAITTLKRSLIATDRALPAEYTTRVAETISTLSRYVAFVKIDSDVEGVAFSVDGEPVRESPVALETGAHTFVASKDGYEPATVTRAVKAGTSEQITLNPERSERPGSARVTCSGVPRCEIYVGEEPLGRAPVVFSRSTGTYLVRATVDGRQWRQQNVEIENGKAIEVALVGGPVPTARLRVMTDRADDVVSVDGVPVGKSGIGVDVRPGDHRIFVTRRDGSTRSLDVLLHEGETRDLRLVVEEKKTISPWWFVGGGALVVGAIATVALLATRPTTFEGSDAGTLNPFVVPASVRGGAR